MTKITAPWPWSQGHSCSGVAIAQAKSKTREECSSECSSTHGCRCISWSTANNHCLLNTGATHADQGDADSSALLLTEDSTDFKYFKPLHSCMGESIGDFVFDIDSCVDSCRTTDKCACVTWSHIGWPNHGHCRMNVGKTLVVESDADLSAVLIKDVPNSLPNQPVATQGGYELHQMMNSIFDNATALMQKAIDDAPKMMPSRETVLEAMNKFAKALSKGASTPSDVDVEPLVLTDITDFLPGIDLNPIDDWAEKALAAMGNKLYTATIKPLIAEGEAAIAAAKSAVAPTLAMMKTMVARLIAFMEDPIPSPAMKSAVAATEELEELVESTMEPITKRLAEMITGSDDPEKRTAGKLSDLLPTDKVQTLAAVFRRMEPLLSIFTGESATKATSEKNRRLRSTIYQQGQDKATPESKTPSPTCWSTSSVNPEPGGVALSFSIDVSSYVPGAVCRDMSWIITSMHSTCVQNIFVEVSELLQEGSWTEGSYFSKNSKSLTFLADQPVGGKLICAAKDSTKTHAAWRKWESQSTKAGYEDPLNAATNLCQQLEFDDDKTKTKTCGSIGLKKAAEKNDIYDMIVRGVKDCQVKKKGAVEQKDAYDKKEQSAECAKKKKKKQSSIYKKCHDELRTKFYQPWMNQPECNAELQLDAVHLQMVFPFSAHRTCAPYFTVGFGTGLKVKSDGIFGRRPSAFFPEETGDDDDKPTLAEAVLKPLYESGNVAFHVNHKTGALQLLYCHFN